MSRQKIIYALIVAMLSAATLTACNTMQGAGQDTKAAGQALENSATKNKGY